MRLICPSCGAQYEVDESVIPDGGRDVQCSNCGHAWFQRSARQLTAAAEEEARATEAAPAVAEPEIGTETAEQPEPEPSAAEEPESETAVAEQPEPEPEEPPAPEVDEPEPAEAEPEATQEATSEEAEETEEEEAVAEPPVEAEAEADQPAPMAEEPPAPERVRRTLDDAVKNVLREEAERETRARQAEGSTLESQPDLGLAATVSAVVASAAEEPDRVARVRGDEHDLDDDALVSRASRRELLPDIEEINSTLRATSERDGEPAAIDAPETLARRRSSFRMGFSTAILIAVLLFGLYLLAPLIAANFPAAEPILSGYVAGVDAVRIWLDGQMKSLTQSLQHGGNGG
ncbi:zinc-ribbon domain-containing protein [Defluviimonas sp. SAOS-178_SWC]|uniref:zinc-ribbon domain-containing protein n=1 Tax=Defluviimonas sp. SAOS-178_SWC TaxID=3121287 RepID=UPI003221449C